MKIHVLILVFLLIGCSTKKIDTIKKIDENVTRHTEIPLETKPVIIETNEEYPQSQIYVQMVHTYNSVLLYALTDEYIQNSKIKYGLFELILEIQKETENVTIYSRVINFSKWTSASINVTNGTYTGFHNVDFNESVLRLMNSTNVTFELYLTYQHMGKRYETGKYTNTFTIIGRKKNMWWSYGHWDSPQLVMQTAWITPHQPEIIELAETKIGLNNTSDYGSAYLLAIEIYNNLFREKIQYKANSIDRRLPIDVLRGEVGDCDEMSALYASVLENLGIETKQVNIPGHQYMLIKLGNYWKGFDPTVTEYWGNNIFADFQYSMELGEDRYNERDENTSVYDPHEAWDMGLRHVSIP